jgi:hypothetical protein
MRKAESRDDDKRYISEELFAPRIRNLESQRRRQINVVYKDEDSRAFHPVTVELLVLGIISSSKINTAIYPVILRVSILK